VTICTSQLDEFLGNKLQSSGLSQIVQFFMQGSPLMKRNKMEENKFDPDKTIHTPIESPYRVYSKHVVFRIIYFEIRLKQRPKVTK
jgi:hypothetical protein